MVRVRVPATTANLGPGYDVLGLALKLYNTVEIEKSDRLSIEIEGEGADSLPKDESNIVYQAAQEVFKTVNGKPLIVNLKLINNIPLARGLGSSAAARVGALVAANRLIGNKLSQDEILKIAARLEGHPDNVTPALVGGLTISYLVEVKSHSRIPGNTGMAKKEVKYLKIGLPEELKIVLAIPDFEVSTKKAREVLPEEVSLEDAVANMGKTALLVSSLAQGNLRLLDIATQDRLHQPYRAKLIPGMERVFKAALANGAKGAFLSGSGSTIAAFSIRNSEEKNKEIGQAMVSAFQKAGHKSYYKILDIDREGTILA